MTVEYRNWKDRRKYKRLIRDAKTGRIVDSPGRPTKCTPETIETICNFIRAGNFIITACKASGISEKTYHNWIKRGETGEEPYKTFLRSVELAESAAEVDLVDGTIQEKGGKKWLLSKRWNERFGDKVEVDNKGSLTLTVEYKDEASE